MSSSNTFDPIWDTIYGEGRQLNRYPYDFVVSFVHRFSPRNKPHHEVRILEVGCGAGNNLWFAAREGFQVSGIDASKSAIAYGQSRFNEEGLVGDLRVGDFTKLPFESDYFDLVIDRAAMTCSGFSATRIAVTEVKRVLREGGKFLFNPYSQQHSSFVAGRTEPNEVTLDISDGSLVGVGQIYFYSRREVNVLFAHGWKLLSVQHHEIIEQLQPQYTIHAEWRVIAEKVQE